MDTLPKNLKERLFLLAQKTPQKTVLLKCNKEGEVLESINFSSLYSLIEKAASWFFDKGIKSGDVVGIAMSNSPELLVLSWAAWAIGVITMPLDMKRDTIEEHIFKLKTSKAKLLITKKDIFLEKEKNDLKEFLIIELDGIDQFKIRDISWKKDLDHRALILFTSGTTAHPRGVLLSLSNLIVNADSIKKWFKISEDDRFMVILPLHHINSTTFCLATLLAGGSIAIFSNYSSSMFWQQSAKTESTFTSIVPSICFDQLSNKNNFKTVADKIKLKKIQIGSAPVVVSDIKEFIKMYSIPIYQGYGQTETALRVTGVPLDLDKKLYQKLIDSNSIGKPMSWADVQIMDSEGNLLKDGEEGEVVVKGKAIMEGYLDKGDAFKNGYFLTGDIGNYKIIQNERYFFLKGRRKEIIIKNGINISPVAVEDRLKKVSPDIDQAYVIGLPNRRSGEEVAAVIVWKDVDIQKAKINLKYNLAKGVKNISQFESPQFIATIKSSNLPMTSTGKVQRSLIKRDIPLNVFESIYLVAETDELRFIQLSSHSEYLKLAFDLYNYCWDPLTLKFNNFTAALGNQIMIAALDKEDKVSGLVSFVKSDLTEKQLSSISYDQLISLKPNNTGKSFICVSICRSNYKKREIPKLTLKITSDEVKKYLQANLDGVYNFHLKPKGGFKKGADLISLIPNGRPEDKSSLGFNMLLKYPKIDQDVVINPNSSVASQLIEVVMFLARQIDVENVYAFSRPAGLAKNLAEKTTKK